jgi:hypothetical protein
MSTVDTTHLSPTLGRPSFRRRAAVGIGTAFVLADAAVAYRAYDQGEMAEGPTTSENDSAHSPNNSANTKPEKQTSSTTP